MWEWMEWKRNGKWQPDEITVDVVVFATIAAVIYLWRIL